jgi:hypothetical protein
VGKSPQRETINPSEALLDHRLKTPLSHFSPQRVKGFVEGFPRLRGVTRIINTLPKIGSQEKNGGEITIPECHESFATRQSVAIIA